MWSVYLLKQVNGSRTYVGATIDVDRRLRQHNGELSGGARATAGSTWQRVCYISGFPNERAALQFEWAWKYTSKKQSGGALPRRAKALLELLGCEKPTSKADDYQSYVHTLHIQWESTIPIEDYIAC
jgi:structure-specific endonuclease subunit SLX1